MTENHASSTTLVPGGAYSAMQDELRKRRNEKFIKNLKKISGQKKQTVLPSAVARHNDWAIRMGWSMQDAITWRRVCEEGKYASDEVDGDAKLELLLGTIDLAGSLDIHPIEVIKLSREQGQKSWDIDNYYALRAILDRQETPPQSPTTEVPSAPRKRALTATQPDFMSDDDIDDKTVQVD